jgi:RNA polymerase sigma-70 factor (ECF subfamily)
MPIDDIARIVARAAQGDEQAWRSLVDRYARRIYAMARSRLGNDDAAEEIAQSVFVTLAEKLPSKASAYAERGRFEAYLFRIAMNRVRDEARRAKRRRAVYAEYGAEIVEAAPAVEQTPESEALRRALADLPDPDRRVVELRHIAGLSFKVMSELMHEPMGTLLARHHRALKKLRKILEGGALSPKEKP